ncbi:MAG: hypothetical protein NTU82_03860, partial [Actinobacteria bacterium]|nr:hypothetical protein [Actinomycetota bacterium]
MASPLPVPSTASCSDSASALCGVGYTYQWQYLDGSTWSNVTDGSGADTPNYTTRALTLDDDGIQYRLGVTTSKNGTSATGYSAAAAVSVAPIKLDTPSTLTGAAVANTTDSIVVSGVAVPNATSYVFTVYNSSGQSVNDVASVWEITTSSSSGITSVNTRITGLTANSSYTVSVAADGDVNYSLSDPSPLSASITTNKSAATPTATTPSVSNSGVANVGSTAVLSSTASCS